MENAGSDQVDCSHVTRPTEDSSKPEHGSLAPRIGRKRPSKKGRCVHPDDINGSTLNWARSLHSTPAAFAKLFQSKLSFAVSAEPGQPYCLEDNREGLDERLRGSKLCFTTKTFQLVDGGICVKSRIFWTDKMQNRPKTSDVSFSAWSTEQQMRLSCWLGFGAVTYTEEIRFPRVWTKVSLKPRGMAYNDRSGEGRIIRIPMAILFPDNTDGSHDSSPSAPAEGTARTTLPTNMQWDDTMAPSTPHAEEFGLADSPQVVSGSAAFLSAPSDRSKEGGSPEISEGAATGPHKSDKHSAEQSGALNMLALPASTIDIDRIPLAAGEVLGFFRSRSVEPRTLIYSSSDSLCFGDDYDLEEAPALCQQLLDLEVSRANNSWSFQ